jgi:hypothetical protein
MTDNKEQTAVQLIIQALDIECKSRGMNVNWDMYLEMEKERIENAFNSGYNNGGLDTCLTPKQYYEQIYGGGEQ